LVNDECLSNKDIFPGQLFKNKRGELPFSCSLGINYCFFLHQRIVRFGDNTLGLSTRGKIVFLKSNSSNRVCKTWWPPEVPEGAPHNGKPFFREPLGYWEKRGIYPPNSNGPETFLSP